MAEPQKTIFMSISRGTLVRNILRTDVLRELLARNVRVVVIVPVPIHEYFKKEFSRENVILEKVEKKHYGKLRKLFTMFVNNLIYTETEYKNIRFGKAGGHPDPLPLFWAKHLAFSVFSRIKFLRPVARWAESFFFPDKDYDYLFEKYRPDALLCSSLYSGADIILMKAARRFGVPSVSMPKSWDTVGRTFFRVIGDEMILNNDFMRQWVVREQFVPQERISICGMPQFDIYVNKKRHLSKEEFCERTGLDANKPIILFASEGLGVHWDEDYVEDLIANHGMLEKYNLIVRPHFSIVGRGWCRQFKKHKNVFVDDERMRITNMFSDKWDPTEVDMDWLAEVLHASDVAITFATTFVLDAFVNNKPVINIFYDLESSKRIKRPLPLVPVKELYDCFHYNAVLAEKPTTLARSGSEVLEWIERYLEHPETLSIERQKTIDKLCYRVDGNSSNRIADTLIRLLDTHLA